MSKAYLYVVKFHDDGWYKFGCTTNWNQRRRTLANRRRPQSIDQKTPRSFDIITVVECVDLNAAYRLESAIVDSVNAAAGRHQNDHLEWCDAFPQGCLDWLAQAGVVDKDAAARFPTARMAVLFYKVIRTPLYTGKWKRCPNS